VGAWRETRDEDVETVTEDGVDGSEAVTVVSASAEDIDAPP